MRLTTRCPALIDCYHNGRRTRLALAEAHCLFWRCAYAWLLPLDWYRWDIQGYSDSVYVYERVKPTPRRFGRHLHTRGKRCLTIEDLEELESARIDIRTFHQRASRFNKIFGDLPSTLRPFLYYEIDKVDGRSQPAYRMRSSRHWCVVVDVVPESGLTKGDVDWTIFLQSPKTAESI